MTNLALVTQDKELTEKFTPKELQLIIDTVAKGATPQELQFFLYRCKLLDLNPLKPGQIFFIKYGNSPGTVVVGIDGFRSNAGRTGKHVSTTRGVTKEGGQITYGWARVKRRDKSGEIQEFYEEVPFAEFNNDKNPTWRKMPETMIKKCAEAAALRMAYPDVLGGVYEEAEKDIIAKDARSMSDGLDQPTEEEQAEFREKRGYTFPFGSFKSMTPKEALAKKGREVLENALRLIDQKLIDGTTYKGVTAEEMEYAKYEIEKVITDLEAGRFDENEPAGFVVRNDEEAPF